MRSLKSWAELPEMGANGRPRICRRAKLCVIYACGLRARDIMERMCSSMQASIWMPLPPDFLKRRSLRFLYWMSL